MPEATFYSLPEEADTALRQSFILRIIEKVQAQGLSLLLRCQDRDEALGMDELLWGGRPESFIAHALVDEELGKPPPVLITWPQARQPVAAVLFNLASELPENLPPCRLLLLVEGDASARARRREQWKWLKERHWQVLSHALKAGTA